MNGSIEIFVGDVNDVEGHVYARYIGSTVQHSDSRSGEPVTLRGMLRGPYCELTRTLPAEFKFHDLGPKETGLARAIIPDPCVWSQDLPLLYQVDVEARQGDQVVAEFHGKIGLRRK